MRNEAHRKRAAGALRLLWLRRVRIGCLERLLALASAATRKRRRRLLCFAASRTAAEGVMQ